MLCGTIVYLGLKHFDTSIAAETMLQGLFNGYTLLAIPLFILAADIMNIGSLADRLLRFSQALVGRFRGGLGHVNVVASLIFSGMSGSAVADAVGMGRIIINLMTKDGKYTPSYAAAITAASATIGPIIPPSIPMVLYALVSDTSIGYLFAGGIVPGLLMGLVLIIMNAVIAHRRNLPVDEAVPLAEIPAITGRAFPALMLPVILLGGIYGGVMTPTEAAAVAAFYALAISVFLYRSVSFGQFYETLLNSARSTATVGVLIAGALAFNFVVTRENVPDSIAAFMQQFRPVANWLSSGDQRPVPRARLHHRGRRDPGYHRADLHPDRAGARHRSGAFRRDRGGQRDARTHHAALRIVALHRRGDHETARRRRGARSLAIHIRADRRAHGHHVRSRLRPLRSAAARLQGLRRCGRHYCCSIYRYRVPHLRKQTKVYLAPRCPGARRPTGARLVRSYFPDEPA